MITRASSGVLYTWRAQEGEIAGRVQPPGALLPMTAVVPQLTGAGAADITFEPGSGSQ